MEGRHGVDPNLAVCIDTVPYIAQGHECRGIIAPGVKRVHAMSLPPRIARGECSERADFTPARLRETILSGVTRTMLAEMNVPILMSH